MFCRLSSARGGAYTPRSRFAILPSARLHKELFISNVIIDENDLLYQISGFSEIDGLYRRMHVHTERRRHRQSDLQCLAALGIAGGAHVRAGVGLFDVLDDQSAVPHHVMTGRLLDRLLPLISVVVPPAKRVNNNPRMKQCFCTVRKRR